MAAWFLRVAAETHSQQPLPTARMPLALCGVTRTHGSHRALERVSVADTRLGLA